MINMRIIRRTNIDKEVANNICQLEIYFGSTQITSQTNNTYFEVIFAKCCSRLDKYSFMAII